MIPPRVWPGVALCLHLAILAVTAMPDPRLRDDLLLDMLVPISNLTRAVRETVDNSDEGSGDDGASQIKPLHGSLSIQMERLEEAPSQASGPDYKESLETNQNTDEGDIETLQDEGSGDLETAPSGDLELHPLPHIDEGFKEEGMDDVLKELTSSEPVGLPTNDGNQQENTLSVIASEERPAPQPAEHILENHQVVKEDEDEGSGQILLGTGNQEGTGTPEETPEKDAVSGEKIEAPVGVISLEDNNGKPLEQGRALEESENVDEVGSNIEPQHAGAVGEIDPVVSKEKGIDQETVPASADNFVPVDPDSIDEPGPTEGEAEGDSSGLIVPVVIETKDAEVTTTAPSEEIAETSSGETVVHAIPEKESEEDEPPVVATTPEEANEEEATTVSGEQNKEDVDEATPVSEETVEETIDIVVPITFESTSTSAPPELAPSTDDETPDTTEKDETASEHAEILVQPDLPDSESPIEESEESTTVVSRTEVLPENEIPEVETTDTIEPFTAITEAAQDEVSPIEPSTETVLEETTVEDLSSQVEEVNGTIMVATAMNVTKSSNQANAPKDVIVDASTSRTLSMYIIVGVLVICFLALVVVVTVRNRGRRRKMRTENGQDRDTEKSLLGHGKFKDDSEDNNIKNNEITPLVIKQNSQINKFEKNPNFSSPKNLNTTANEKNIEKDNVLKSTTQAIIEGEVEDVKKAVEDEVEEEKKRAVEELGPVVVEKVVVRTHMDLDSIPRKPVFLSNNGNGYHAVPGGETKT